MDGEDQSELSQSLEEREWQRSAVRARIYAQDPRPTALEGGPNGSMLEEVTIEHHARLAELAKQRRALRQKLAEITGAFSAEESLAKEQEHGGPQLRRAEREALAARVVADEASARARIDALRAGASPAAAEVAAAAAAAIPKASSADKWAFQGAAPMPQALHAGDVPSAEEALPRKPFRLASRGSAEASGGAEKTVPPPQVGPSSGAGVGGAPYFGVPHFPWGSGAFPPAAFPTAPMAFHPAFHPAYHPAFQSAFQPVFHPAFPGAADMSGGSLYAAAMAQGISLGMGMAQAHQGSGGGGRVAAAAETGAPPHSQWTSHISEAERLAAEADRLQAEAAQARARAVAAAAGVAALPAPQLPQPPPQQQQEKEQDWRHGSDTAAAGEAGNTLGLREAQRMESQRIPESPDWGKELGPHSASSRELGAFDAAEALARDEPSATAYHPALSESAPLGLEVELASLGPLPLPSPGGRLPQARCVLRLYSAAGRGAAVHSALQAAHSASQGGFAFRFGQTLLLRCGPPSPAALLLLEVLSSPEAGAPEEVVAWATLPAAPGGAPPLGQQVVPLLRLPVSPSAAAQAEPFSEAVVLLRTRLLRRPAGAGGRALAVDDAPHGSRPNQQPDGERSEEDVPGVPVEAYRLVRRSLAAAAGGAFEPGSGFVLCVDGARFLPECVTLSRVLALVVAPSGAQLWGSVSATAALDSPARCPRFGLRVPVATAGWPSLGGATLLLRLEALAGSGAASVLGFAALSLFAQPEAGSAPVLLRGGFQLPLHCRLGGADGFSAASVAAQPRLPCASLLLRLQPAAAGPSAAAARVPAYGEEGAYDTSAAFPTAAERTLLPLRLPALRGERVRQRLLTQLEATGWEVPADVRDDELREWALDRLAAEAEAAGGELPPFNLRRCGRYVPRLGFALAVDGALRLRPALHCVIQSLAPPAVLYGPRRLPGEGRFTQQPDLDSPLGSPRWKDGYAAYRDVPYDPHLCVVLDLRCAGEVGATPVGWGLVPVFEPGGGHSVASGPLQVPLLQGTVQPELLAELAAGGGSSVATTVAAWLADGRARLARGCSSVLVRLLDGQLADGHLAEAASPDAPLPTYVPAALRPGYRGAGDSSQESYATHAGTHAEARRMVERTNLSFSMASGLAI